MKMKYYILLSTIILLMLGIAIATYTERKLSKIEVAKPLEYARLYADSTGASHFEDTEFTFELVDFAPPAPPISVSQAFDSDKVFIISSPFGWHGDWHPAPQRQFIFVLSGELQVEVSDGELRRFGPGSVVFVEDTFGKGHISRAVSDDRVYAVVVPVEDE